MPASLRSARLAPCSRGRGEIVDHDPGESYLILLDVDGLSAPSDPLPEVTLLFLNVLAVAAVVVVAFLIAWGFLRVFVGFPIGPEERKWCGPSPPAAAKTAPAVASCPRSHSSSICSPFFTGRSWNHSVLGLVVLGRGQETRSVVVGPGGRSRRPGVHDAARAMRPCRRSFGRRLRV